jgi:hypothetical protein
MPIQVTAEAQLFVGRASVIEGKSPDNDFLAVFEDDEDTGYFYAVDTSAAGNPIQDAVHIYNVRAVMGRDKPSSVKIGWSTDSKKAVLLINDYPHAIFDFEAQRGYCRTAFPSPDSSSNWRKHGHEWTDDAVQLFV